MSKLQWAWGCWPWFMCGDLPVKAFSQLKPAGTYWRRCGAKHHVVYIIRD